MRAIITALCLLVVVSFGASAWALNDRFQQGDKTRGQIAAVQLSYCKEIEGLKTAQRNAAWKAWRDLDQTLRLLHIPKTQEVVRLARDSRNAKLRTFKADPCPRKVTQ